MIQETTVKYPKVADDCEECFIEGDFELICGKRNIYGEWHLCPKCRKLRENKSFKLSTGE